MYIDFSGKKLQITDKSTAKKQDVELFIAILPHRQYPDVQACRSQQRSDLICCCPGALAFYGGVPQMMVLDNLKAAVDRVTKQGSKVHREFKDFANHYQTVVCLTRAYRPTDQDAISLVYQRIKYAMDGVTFFY